MHIIYIYIYIGVYDKDEHRQPINRYPVADHSNIMFLLLYIFFYYKSSYFKQKKTFIILEYIYFERRYYGITFL